jgi:uncharacterized protein
MAADLGVTVAALVGNPELARSIDTKKYVEAGEGVRLDALGDATLRDIVAELGKPGRDPRKTFEPPKFRDDVRTMDDLRPGMVLEGVVTNVTAFGAFVDVGVHQDGLVHVSQLSDRFVRDPSEAAKVGDRLTVRVLEVDLSRKRISLSARKEADASQGNKGGAFGKPAARPEQGRPMNPKGGRGQPNQGSPRDAKPADEFRYNPFAALLRK